MNDDAGPHAELPARITELGLRLQAHGDVEVADDVRELLQLVDDFHRRGLTALVEMIQAWRGEIPLDSLARNEPTAALLEAYGLPGPGEPA